MINQITTLRPDDGLLTDAAIQEHMDAQNADGWHLIAVDNLIGWYRFFWGKEVE